jgi:plasmid stability protein
MSFRRLAMTAATLAVPNVPVELLDRIRRSASAHNRPFEDEVVWLLDRALAPAPPLNRAVPASEDELPVVGMLPLPGPSRQVDPLPGGYLRPLPPVSRDDRS